MGLRDQGSGGHPVNGVREDQGPSPIAPGRICKVAQVAASPITWRRRCSGRLGRVPERDPVRAAARRGPPAAAALSGRAADQKTLSSPGSWQRDIPTWQLPLETAGGTGARLPSHSRQPGLGFVASSAERPGGPLVAASRPDGTTTIGHERLPGRGLGGEQRAARSRCDQPLASQGGICLTPKKRPGPGLQQWLRPP